MSKQGGSMKSIQAGSAPSDDVAAPASAANDEAASSAPTLPPPSSSSPASMAPGSATGKSKKKKSSSKKKGTRKSKAPPSNGETFELTPTPSTSAPPIVSKRAPTSSANEIVAAAATAPSEDLDDHDFFRASSAPVSMTPSGSGPAHHDFHDLHEETRDPRIEKLMTAEVKRRRAHFAKYVKAAVAISLVLCLAAVVRVGIRRNHSDDSTTAMAATSQTQVRPPPVAVVPDPVAQKPIDPPPPAETAAVDTTATAEPVAAPTASADPSASAQAAAPSASAAPSVEPAPSAAVAAPSAEPTELDPKAALKEKRKSQQLLDQGRIVDAIQHGEESVKLDPTDAEAWLILGAAYQMKGDQKEAKRCFGSCIKEGKRGPKGECMAMPH